AKSPHETGDRQCSSKGTLWPRFSCKVPKIASISGVLPVDSRSLWVVCMVMGGDCLVICSSTPENYQSLTPGLPVRFTFLMPLGELLSANRSSSDLKFAIQRRSSFWSFTRNLTHGNQKKPFDVRCCPSAGAGGRYARLCGATL